MKLPPSITFEQTFLGSGDATTIRGQENGQAVIVKSLDVSGNLLAGLQLEEESQSDAVFQQFDAEKQREQKAAEQSECYLKGRLERYDGALFWIRSYMRRSLHDKVAFKETPGAIELGKICRAIVRALAKLNEIDQSGHGNLSLSNVLIAEDDIRDLKLIDLRVANEANERADKRALGLIIYQLVNGEFVELDEKISAVPDEQDWKVLGAAEPMWREFCSELLNPYGKYAKSDWRQIDQDLSGIDAFHAKRKKLKVSVVISLLIICSSGLFLIWKLRFQQEEVVVDLNTIQGQWLELLDEYFAWGDNYLRSKSSFEHIRNAPEFMQRFYDDKKARIPVKIIGRLSGKGALMQTAPAEVYAAAKIIDVVLLDNNKQQQIVIAHKFIVNIRDEIKNWEVLQELSEAHAAFVSSGFEFGADETRRLLDSISFEDGSLSLSRLYALQVSADGLGELQDLYDRFQVALTVLDEQTQSAFLPLYGADLKRRLAQPADDPVSHLRMLADIASALRTYWEEEQMRIEQSLFIEAENVFLQAPNFIISDQKSLSDWKALVEGFRLIDIPLLQSGRDQFIGSEENFRQLTEQINELQEPALEPATFDQQFTQLFQQFEAEVNLPQIESNRESIENAVRLNLRALQSLLEATEDRWAEVNPDIGERLKQLSQLPESLSGDLLAAWQEYLAREISVRTEESFSGPREFIVFQRAYYAKLRNFEYFQEKQLSRLPRDWVDRISDTIRPDLVPAMQATRQLYYDRLVSEWVADMVPIMLRISTEASLAEPSQAYLERMQAHEAQSVAYAQLLGETLDGIDSWELPDRGINHRWSALNEGTVQQDTELSMPFEPYRQQVKIYYDLEQQFSADQLLAVALDDTQPDFARVLALRISAESTALAPSALGQVAALIPALRQQVPIHKIDDFEGTLRALWNRAFEDGSLNPSDREAVFSYRDIMGVRAVDLIGNIRIDFEIYAALDLLRNNESLYTEKPALLEELINTFASLPDHSRDARLNALIAQMREVDLTQVKATFEDAAFLTKGWAIENETEEQLILRWQGYQLNFYRVEDEQGDFFLAEQECSIGLFNDWMSKNKLWDQSADSLPREWELFLDQSYNAIDDDREGMKPWAIGRRGLKRNGLMVANTWFDVDPVVLDEYKAIEPELFPNSLLNEDLPIQHVGARLAFNFAESMGMALPTPGQWQLAVQGHSGSSAFFWQERLETSMSRELVSDIRIGSYYVERKIEESGYGATQAVVLAPVNQQSNQPFKHLAGNIAEYLYDPDANKYYVAGGSALATTAGTWQTEHVLSKRNERTAFSDVGIRLSLIAPEQSAYNQFLAILGAVLK